MSSPTEQNALKEPLMALAHAGYKHASSLYLIGARLAQHARRTQLLAETALRAAWARSSVSLEIARDAQFGRRTQILVAPRTSSRLRIASGCRLGDDVRLELRGGQILLGPNVEIREHAMLTAVGRLELEGHNLIQRDCSIHCDEAVLLGKFTVLAEKAVIVDSSHFYSDSSLWWLDNLSTAAVTIGSHVWIGSKATVAKGVKIGDGSIVAANSLVVKDVPDGYMATGVPASLKGPVHGAKGDDSVPS